MSVLQGGQIVEPGGVYVKPVESGSPSSGSISPQIPYNDPGSDTNNNDTTNNKKDSGYDPNTDYSTLFDFFGLPPELKAKIQQLIAEGMSSANPDWNTIRANVLGYIRGTDWYAKTYAGIQYGIAAGLFGDNPEQAYRQYVNSVTQYYKQYLNRDVTSEEIIAALKEGADPALLGKRLEGQSYANANRGDWQYLLGAFGEGQVSDSDITSLGQEGVGLKSSIGDKLQLQLDKAMQRMHGVFQGVLATPNMTLNKNNRLVAPSLSGSTNAGDIGA